MSFNIDALRNAINKGKNVMYANSNRESDTNFFNLYKDISWNDQNRQYQSFVRIVVKPKTNGFAFQMVHPKVGFPGHDPKTFACPKFVDPKNTCILCDVGPLANDADMAKAFIDWPDKKDGRPIIKPKSVADIIRSIGAEQRIILVVCEPKLMADPAAPDSVKGLQIWFAQKRTLVKKLKDTMKNFPPDHFSDPKDGTALMVTFAPKAPPMDMYNVMPYRVMPFDPALCDQAPDPEQYTSKLRTPEEMLEKLREMLPGIEL